MDEKKVLSIYIEEFQNMALARSTGKSIDEQRYKSLREHLVGRSEIKDVLPRFVFTCRDPDQLWSFIKPKIATYEERRKYIRQEFQPVWDLMEGRQTQLSSSIQEAIQKIGSDAVHREWTKALARRTDDPEGAITMARTLLESVCKHILDDASVSYKTGEELPKLYSKCSTALKIAPSQHTEEIFRQILGGCAAVVEGLGALRNRISDAHGNGRNAVKPGVRHAHLAVNLAGSMATYLIETWESKKK